MLANQFQRLMGGGFYFLEPSYLMGDYIEETGQIRHFNDKGRELRAAVNEVFGRK